MKVVVKNTVSFNDLKSTVSFNDMVKTAVSLAKPYWVQANERLLGIQTESKNGQAIKEQISWRQDGSGFSSLHGDSFPYSSIDYWNIRDIIKVLDPEPDDVFYDIGAGMGRVVCMMARQHLRKCVGIELSDPLWRIARANARKLRGRHSPIEMVCEDATTADLSDGTLYFFYNPFGENSMREVLENIRQSWLKQPRHIKIAYCNPTCEHLFQRSGWLTPFHEMRLLGGHEVLFWQSMPLHLEVVKRP